MTVECVDSSVEHASIIDDNLYKNASRFACIGEHYERGDMPPCVTTWLNEHLTQRQGGDVGIEECDFYGSKQTGDNCVWNEQEQYLIEENELICCLLGLEPESGKGSRSPVEENIILRDLARDVFDPKEEQKVGRNLAVSSDNKHVVILKPVQVAYVERVTKLSKCKNRVLKTFQSFRYRKSEKKQPGRFSRLVHRAINNCRKFFLRQ